MKKHFLLTAIFFIAASTAFANVELCFNNYFIPSSTRTYRCPDGDVANAAYSLTGSETNLSIYFGREKKNLDVGINGAFGMEYFRVVSFDWTDFSVKFAGELTASLGPIFRYTFSDIHSVSICPALQFNAGFLWDRILNIYGQFDFAFAVNAMYKCYFLNVDGFHLGLNLGLGYSKPFSGAFTGLSLSHDGVKLQNSTDLISGHDIRIYVGMCMNFGDRGRDRKN